MIRTLKQQFAEKKIDVSKIDKLLELVKKMWKGLAPGHFDLDFAVERDGLIIAAFTFAKDIVPVESSLTMYKYEKWFCLYCDGDIVWLKNEQLETLLLMLDINKKGIRKIIRDAKYTAPFEMYNKDGMDGSIFNETNGIPSLEEVRKKIDEGFGFSCGGGISLIVRDSMKQEVPLSELQ